MWQQEIDLFTYIIYENQKCAAYNTPSCNISKFLVPILSKLTVNEYTAENSFKFFQDVGNLTNSDNLFMASFDVENLFTNVSLNETMNIILYQLFILPNSTVIGLTEASFKTLLEHSVHNTICFMYRCPVLTIMII